jgi:CheY-like chemotaxis protein
MKVLIVDPDAARASSLGDALAASGARPAVAPSASFALTMLEWNQQDVIISRASAGDMEGQELCAFVRADPSTKSVKFVLVANDVTPAQAAQIGIDLVIPEGLIGQAIVTRVTHLMRRDGDVPSTASTPAARAATAVAGPSAPVVPSPVAPAPSEPVPPASPPAAIDPVPVAPAPVDVAPAPPSPVPPMAAAPQSDPAVLVAPPTPAPDAPVEAAPVAASPAAAPTARPKSAAPAAPPLTELEAVGLNGAMRTFQGALGSLKLEDLTQAIASGSKTGRLLLVLGTGGGMIAFDGGRIVHAEVGNTTGETAFHALVRASHRESAGKFCFIPSAPRDLANVPKTITRSVPDLLLGAARAMDEES